MTPPLSPRPVSDALDRHLKNVLAKIPTGKRGQAELTVTTTGVEAQVGAQFPHGVTAGGWAGKEWGGTGWSAGARVGVVW